MNGVKKLEKELFEKERPLDKKELSLAIENYKKDREKYHSSLIINYKRWKKIISIARFIIPFLILFYYKNDLNTAIIVVSIMSFFLIDFIRQSIIVRINYRSNYLVNEKYPMEKLDIVPEEYMKKNLCYFFMNDNRKNFKHSNFLDANRPIIKAEFDKIMEEAESKIL